MSSLADISKFLMAEPEASRLNSKLYAVHCYGTSLFTPSLTELYNFGTVGTSDS